MFDSPVMGIDPGLTRCGWGVVARGDRSAARNRSTPGVVGHGVIGSRPDVVTGERLRMLRDGIAALVDEHRPRAVALEKVLFNANVRTAMATGQAAGIVLLVCAEAGIPVTSYAPTQVKLAVAGSGAADKKQMRRAVTAILRLEAEPRTDAADALALALCHCAAAPLAGAVRTASTPRSVTAADGSDGAERLRRAVAAAVAADDARRSARSVRGTAT